MLTLEMARRRYLCGKVVPEKSASMRSPRLKDDGIATAMQERRTATVQ